MTNPYDIAYARSIDDPEGFWGEAAEAIVWTKKWDKVLDDVAAPVYRWFSGGELNTCYNCLDRHVDEGNGDRTALIYDSPVTGGTKRSYTYEQLRDEVARFAGVLAARGVGKGDRVIIYMPMVPEAAVAMLACARLGAIHSVVFGGFASHELAVRIDDATPKAIVSATCGIEVNRVIEYLPLLKGAIDGAKHKPETVIVLGRPECEADVASMGYLDWAAEMAGAQPHDCVPVAATDPLYILYTSGTTGQPKGVVRDNGGHAVALKWSMKYVYDADPGDVYWAASDVGWVVGHSYIVYAPLLHGCTTLMYEGKPVGTPDAGAFWRVIADHGVKILFTAPTAFRAIKKEDPNADLLKNYDMSKFELLFLAGERTDPDTLNWAQKILGVPVIDHWWQTETGWAIAANCMGLHRFPVKPGSPTKPCPGWNVQILDAETHEPVAPGTVGAICIKLPMPPSSVLSKPSMRWSSVSARVEERRSSVECSDSMRPSRVSPSSRERLSTEAMSASPRSPIRYSIFSRWPPRLSVSVSPRSASVASRRSPMALRSPTTRSPREPMRWASSVPVSDRVRARIDELATGLPEGVTIETYYDRSVLVDRTIIFRFSTVRKVAKARCK